MTDSQVTAAGPDRHRISATQAVVGFSAVIATVATLGALSLPERVPAGVEIAPVVLVALFIITERWLTVHLLIREEGHTFTFSEVTLCIGLMYATPARLLACALVATLLSGALSRRTDPIKLVFNIAQVMAQMVVAVAIFDLITGLDASPQSVRTWCALIAAGVAADALSALLVTGVMRLYRGIFARREFAWSMASGAIASITKSAAGVLAVLLWSTGYGAALVLLAVLVAATLSAFRNAAAVHHRYRQLELLYRFTRVVGRAVTADHVAPAVLEGARDLLNADRAELAMEDRRGRIVRWVLTGSGEPERSRGRADETDPLWNAVVGGGRTLLVAAGTRPEGEPDGMADALAEHGIDDCLAAPLQGESGLRGMLLVANRRDAITTFDDEDAKLFGALVNHASVSLQNGRLVEELQSEAAEREHRALHDALTGLANRTHFLEIADRTIRAGGRRESEPAGAVLLLGLDHFRDVNDTLGHHNGDAVLQEVARRIRTAVGPERLVARVSGDEFAILVDEGEEDDARRLGGCVAAAIAEPLMVSGLALEVGASIGVALIPDHGDDAATLLRRADVAMHLAKRDEAGVQCYDAERDPHSPRRLALAYQLRQALDRNELVAYFQPKMDLRTRRVIGAEALVRWRHPQLGMLFPDEFIPVAEKTGLIGPLTLYMLEASLRQRGEWARHGLHLGMAVNISARNLSDPALPEQIADILQRTHCPPEALTLEVTESQIMADPQRAARALERITDLGVTIAIDDFGTGFSSLSSLRAMPVGEIKIDKSFVFHVTDSDDDAVIVRSTAELGKNLGLRVVAEGVEAAEALDVLTEFGVDAIQGYWLSRPLPADELEAWLHDGVPEPHASPAA